MNRFFHNLCIKVPTVVLFYFWIKMEYLKYSSEKKNIKNLYQLEQKGKPYSTNLLKQLIKLDSSILIHLLCKTKISSRRDVSIFFSYLIWDVAWNPLSPNLVKLIEYKIAKKFINKFATPRTYFKKQVKSKYRSFISEFMVTSLNNIWNLPLNNLNIEVLNNINFYYQLSDGKPTLLIFHDIGLNLSKWTSLLTKLKEHNYGFILPEIPGISLTYYSSIPNRNKLFETIFSVIETKSQLHNVYILGDGFGTILMTQFLKLYFDPIKPKKLFYLKPICFFPDYSKWNYLENEYNLCNETWIHYYLNTMYPDNSITELFMPKNTWILVDKNKHLYQVLSEELNIIDNNIVEYIF